MLCGISSNSINSIAVILPDVSGEFSAALISGIESCLARNNYSYFIVSHRGIPEMLRNNPIFCWITLSKE